MTVTVTTQLTILFILYHSGCMVSASEWSYGDEGHWRGQCKSGSMQSPIALSPIIAEKTRFPAFIFEKYGETYPVQTKNNGHSAEIRLHVEVQPSIRGGGLPHVFVLDNLHFHWSSEHTIDGYRFPLELHLVHYAREYHNLTNALKYRNGVAVFAVLFDLSPDDDVAFEPLIDVVDKLQNEEENAIEQMTFTIEDYLPRDTAGYYRYNGSLTTPDCTEGLIWTVFTNTLPISKSQVESFAKLKSHQRSLSQNYRSLQSLNDRKVYLKVSPIRRTPENNNTSSKTNASLLFNFLIFILLTKLT